MFDVITYSVSISPAVLVMLFAVIVLSSSYMMVSVLTSMRDTFLNSVLSVALFVLFLTMHAFIITVFCLPMFGVM